MVELSFFRDELGEGDGSEVADGHLILRGVFDDFSTEVRGPDGTEVLLVGLAVGGVLVQHVGYTCLDLALDDLEPELLRLDGLAPFAFRFVFFVERFEFWPP